MTNIPTDLLRTLVAVVDLRSYTKAAAFLGITQPAVSAQIKRLQFLLGTDLFDRRVQGVSLTAHGQSVVSQARRLLSINDQILALGVRGTESKAELLIRIGTPSDFIASYLPDTLARFRARWPDVRFSVRTQPYDPLVRQLHNGEIDVMVAQTMAPPHDARHLVEQEVVWVRSPSMRFDPSDPVPLVSGGDSSTYRRLAVQMLREAGLHWEDVFTSPSMYSLSNAVAAGLGVMPISRRRARAVGLPVWEDTPLPILPPLYSGIYVREGGARASYEQLADEIANMLFGPASAQLSNGFARAHESAA
ncbi:LysR family transcriptional regulator [Pseudolabrys taiwanensis]|uniref:LysR family transcriptional regulator n=1 Tax=Pseudolabrys taiwanensis TaxID=331696 RepID=A0A345ZXZ5_9HYPH|nr:LysR family transcriptional regulator [Pseudolabrys taiwanensis]AXK81792.1 LysR family transcriptional regulator [Pseudolabrys taiwanensis]